MSNVKIINFEELSSKDLKGLELLCVKPISIYGLMGPVEPVMAGHVVEKIAAKVMAMAEKIGCSTVGVCISEAAECNLVCGFPSSEIAMVGVATLNFYRRK